MYSKIGMAYGDIKNRIFQNIEKLEGRSYEEVAEILGYDSPKNCYSRLKDLERNKKLKFQLKDKTYSGFEITDKNWLARAKKQGELSELSQIKIRLYVEDVLNMRDIANNPAIRATERIKATENKQRALKHLEGTYALEMLKAQGIN